MFILAKRARKVYNEYVSVHFEACVLRSENSAGTRDVIFIKE